ncbi:M56 family metallopeptidase [Vulcaniibacterium tengchongense]|uniref:Protein TonB n=1 Tax=Vulcaniibacterium tengchongense TaxID=1273429 RepID=A0A3N4UVM7_9GAMM|nr:TonB family protein [Vulcaniibacterium tengchongense]RPE74806.1 TonB family protein [Vulcaniibacterium tengchongense]
MAWFGAQQYRFRRGLGRLRARADGSWQSASCAGLPATLGLWRPRIVVPAGFDRYDAAQRAVMLAHERGHIARGDPCANAVAAALRCLFWFDPLLHFAARHFRHDQELACDQRVVARHPQHRRAYGEAMLQIQLAAQPLPLGCHWGYSHPLKQRIEMLKRPTPTVARRFGGGLLVAACVGCASFAAWALQPAPSPMNPTSEASLPAPKYPADALAAKVSGKVVLLIDLDANGVPTQVQVERSEPAGVFDAAAVSAARQWRFEPSRENGRAVPGRVRVPVTFEARGQPGAPAGGSGMARALPTPAAVAG